MEKRLLQLLLNHKFFSDNRNRLVKTMFPDQFETIFDLICDAHDKYKRDITLAELRQLVRVKYPTITQAQLTVIHEFITDIEETKDPIGEDVAQDVISSIWRMEIGRQIAQLGVELAEGKQSDLSKLSRLIETTSKSFVPENTFEACPTDFDYILDYQDNVKRWKFNLSTLHMVVPGLAPGEFAVAFARPEVGKTAFHVSAVFGRDGFLDQGAKVLLFLNEEAAVRTLSRGLLSATGFTMEQLKGDETARSKAKDIWNSLTRNLTVREGSGQTIDGIKGLVKDTNPDIVIIDQIDKLSTEGSFAREDQEMGAIYVEARDIAKAYKCVVLGICQASAEAEGKRVVTFNMMAKSKTDKAAELDLAIGIGATLVDDNAPPSKIRYITISKNKINGWHGTVNCILENEMHRYVA